MQTPWHMLPLRISLSRLCCFYSFYLLWRNISKAMRREWDIISLVWTFMPIRKMLHVLKITKCHTEYLQHTYKIVGYCQWLHLCAFHCRWVEVTLFESATPNRWNNTQHHHTCQCVPYAICVFLIFMSLLAWSVSLPLAMRKLKIYILEHFVLNASKASKLCKIGENIGNEK